MRRSFPRHALLSLIRTPVISKVDHCVAVFTGTRGQLLGRLSAVLNATARLVSRFLSQEIRAHLSTGHLIADSDAHRGPPSADTVSRYTGNTTHNT